MRSSSYIDHFSLPTRLFIKKLLIVKFQYRRAARGSRYMRLQLKICSILFLINSTATACAYYIALSQCSSTWLQVIYFCFLRINVQLGEVANALMLVITLFNCSHYMGGKIHRLVWVFFGFLKIFYLFGGWLFLE
jgi:hypothetical protein